MRKLLLLSLLLGLLFGSLYLINEREGALETVAPGPSLARRPVVAHQLLKSENEGFSDSSDYVSFWLLLSQLSLTENQVTVLSESEKQSMIADVERLQRELFLHPNFSTALTNARQTDEWQAFINFILAQQSSTSYRGEDNYSVSDILIGFDVPDEVIKKNIDSYPPTRLSIISLIHSRKLENSPAIMGRILSYFTADLLIDVDIAGMNQVNLLQLAKKNGRDDITNYYDVSELMASNKGKFSEEGQDADLIKDNDRSLIRRSKVYAPYQAKRIQAKNTEQCRKLASTGLVGQYGDEFDFTEFNYSEAMRESMAIHAHHLQQFLQRKLMVLNDQSLPDAFVSRADRYFYSTAIYKFMNDNSENIDSTEYIPDFYGVQIATVPHYPSERVILLENLVKQQRFDNDRLATLAYIAGSVDELAWALNTGVNLQPAQGEDVLHWSYRNQALKESQRLLSFLKRYNFDVSEQHKAMHDFKVNCLAK